MGALTSNRKRGDDYLGFNRTTNSSAYENHISKKPRFSHNNQSPDDRSVSSKSSVSRIYRYPETSTPLRREVHAPTRIFKFNLSARLVRESSIFRKREARVEEDERGDIMGNFLSHRYERAKSSAFDSLRYVKKDKEVIDVDEEEVRVEEVSDDSSVEEIEFVEDGREGRSVVLDQRSRDNNEAAIKVEELDTKPSYSSAVTDLTNDSWKMENAEKMLDALSLNEGMNVEPVHKRLLNSAERRNPKLNSLSFQIDYQMQRWSKLRLLRPVKKPEEVVPKEAFAPLTNEEEEEVARAFSANRRRVLVTHETSNIEITGEILQCLRPGAWLNDEVINLYLELLKERERRDPKKFLKCHFFNTFFYKKLIGGRDGYDFKSVKRWTTQRKLGYGLIECDKIFVPIHKEIHWCLAVINKKDEKFQYLDSLGGTDSKVLKKLARYFVDEVNDKSGIVIDVSSWEQEFVEDLPDQRNGWDCGMFMVKYADFYSRGVGLCFNQEHMPYFRLRTAKEILRLKAD